MKGFIFTLFLIIIAVNAVPENCFMCLDLVRELEEKIKGNDAAKITQLVNFLCKSQDSESPAGKVCSALLEKGINNLLEMIMEKIPVEKMCKLMDQC
ncbi:hypothetical protein KM1_071050 [Entamoeba histolytica HM-3:IMSS]|uniref:Saposin B-type domain-containing protein n=1 Tax=Entamoeba histolytica HM-3:IMSS TaxID=885315 RepID=M7WJ95_ENTHI|nr:hypothetical protein KM1_071050 [Entamoeba histolytica HM-3:IMSS]